MTREQTFAFVMLMQRREFAALKQEAIRRAAMRALLIKHAEAQP